MRSLGSNHLSRSALQFFFDRPELTLPLIGDIWAGIQPAFLPEKPGPSVFLAAFLPRYWIVLHDSTWALFLRSRRTIFMFFSWCDSAWIVVDFAKIRSPEKQSRRRGIRVCRNPGFQESRFCPETFECLQRDPRALAWWNKVQTGPSARCNSVPPCSVLQKRVIQSLFSWLPLKSRPSFPFCIKFTQNLYFSIFLHKNQKHIKVGKFLVFFYIKHMQKANNI